LRDDETNYACNKEQLQPKALHFTTVGTNQSLFSDSSRATGDSFYPVGQENLCAPNSRNFLLQVKPVLQLASAGHQRGKIIFHSTIKGKI